MHTITIGGYNNQKTFANEITNIVIDDVNLFLTNLPPVAVAGDDQVIECSLPGAAEASFDLLVKKSCGSYRPHFRRLKDHVDVESVPGGPLLTEATVKIRVRGEAHLAVGEGVGPVDALDAALRKAIKEFYPEIDGIVLRDYKVRIINPVAATDASRSVPIMPIFRL